ncbi:hypothetical protein BaRGS_00021197, partial [Batillaria attramentaria]
MDRGASSEADFDHYIRIPSDLFEEISGRPAPTVTLPMAATPGRSAGIYPPPRPLIQEQPWTIQQRLLQRCRSPLEKSVHRPGYLMERQASRSCDRRHSPRRSFVYQDVWHQNESHPAVGRRMPLSYPLVRKDT